MLPRLAVCLLAVVPVWPWSGKGHRIIATIAEQKLAAEHPAALEAIRRVIGKGVSLADLSACADDIREFGRCRRPELPQQCMVREKEARERYADTGGWHYINIPFDSRGRYPLRSGVVERIEFFKNQIDNPRLSNRTRAIALMFLVHLVGDIHQPLHAIERNGDQGGNLVFVRIDGRNMRLHSLWDGYLVRDMPAPSGFDLDHVTPQSWALESYEDARRFAYWNVPNQPSSETDPIVLPSDYRRRAEACVHRRLYAAGIRLAELLRGVAAP